VIATTPETLMDIEIRDQLVEALLSKKYRQHRGHLRKMPRGVKATHGGDRTHKAGAFCALGVLCDIMFPDQWGRPDANGVCEMMGSRTYPPKAALRVSGLDGQSMRAVQAMNDDGKDFRAIAEWIKNNL